VTLCAVWCPDGVKVSLELDRVLSPLPGCLLSARHSVEQVLQGLGHLVCG
jgi:hypothetical protein